MKFYEKPDCSIKMFEVTDIITVSGDTGHDLEAATLEGSTAWQDDWNKAF